MNSAHNLSSDILSKVFKKNENVVSRRIAGEFLLVPVRGKLADMQRIFTLNPVAEYIWQGLGEKNLNDICNGVVSTFEVKKEQAENDIREFIEQLLDTDLIKE
jgi:hypothetical protein